MSLDAVVFGGALWLAIPIAMLAGLVSFVSPCVLPLIPGYLGFIGGAVAPRGGAADGAAPGGSRGRLVGGVLLFIAGFTLVFVTLIVLGGLAGSGLQQFSLLYGDLITRILGVVIILMGVVFIGFLGFAQRIARPQVKGDLGLIGAPLLGIALGIGWAPCIGPTLTAIMSLAIIQGDGWRAAVLGLAYSLGLGIPFLLVALGFGWVTRSTAFLRRHIRVVNIVGGVLLIVLGLLMVAGLWTDVMSRLGVLFATIEPPL
ncbi:cytochrome C biogenesis protein CcdA [Microbacterium barkeri]|uniref:Cytochrome C biogenesis protein CcdA n=1 Tax=Microbacterium barkeri TaxID=33917 RepID=A0A9W6H6H6_9MICO|nr:cytochrome c biogenesis protein CcdA [Microbacterium barkeri]MDR6877097.1 cytochrome c-type biogenesis protein [Microbacterium barkeri]GLJ62869.1 cytochrome C biogenesis protein CcdA [Microbacterium barkeri]